ncbi:hypothetical protein AUJ83_02655 [Candidatus Woesearchaeota archaeon CG1_02_33_12]|nr:MAG: hypothetical protein AUJ83_02655 [Candidatus Woesearchaeota archaeon CG1_02_33_12]PIN79290.1 MAG: hypothetical protein COV14_00135 [Candidatus Woesearchaeota archaeon CG10_big_fil_rev_8_21_14_0_10_33_12]PIU72703.1 MAG: hypothetical protein COS79_01540 [Candidatus Woesearchaeota archaeon CG06_land_8_20_14_3_00_33_13]
MEKKITYTISLIFLVVGLSFLVNSQANITGAVIGVSTLSSTKGYFTGAFFILISFVLFAASIGGLEKKIKVIDHIREIKSIEKLSKISRKDPLVAEYLDQLRYQLGQGNTEGGRGSKNIPGTKIYESRIEKARLYYIQTKDGFDVIGESSKNNQQKVIDALKRYYT